MDDNNAKFQEEMNRISAALSDVGVAIREFVTAAAPLLQELANIIVPSYILGKSHKHADDR